jgi:Glycosyl transferase family 2
MALLTKIETASDLGLTIDWPAFNPQDHTLSLAIADRAHHLVILNALEQERTWSIHNPAHALERLLKAHAHLPCALWITEPSRTQCLHIEPLLCDASVWLSLVDFAVLARQASNAPPCPRPGMLAIFTQVYNDSAMLQWWLRHYLRWAEPAGLHVIDHGSEPPLGAADMPPGVQRVRLPRGLADHDNIAQFCNYYQRFLLTQYRWVLHVDVDELLVCVDGPEALFARLEALAQTQPDAIVQPHYSVDLLEQVGIDAPLDSALPLGQQRARAWPNPQYQKPLLLAQSATWGPGFHYVMESQRLVHDEQLWMVHLAHADTQLALQRNRKWHTTAHSKHDAMRVAHHHRALNLEQHQALLQNLDQSPQTLNLPEQVLRGLF